jgi:hypothetical protein
MFKYLCAPLFLLVMIGIWLKDAPLSLLLENSDSPLEYEIECIDFLQQPDGITCGPTSATMVLHYFGHDVSLDQVRQATRTDWFKYKDQKIGMTIPDCVVEGLRQFGLYAIKRIGDINDIKSFVSKDHPVIVLLRSGEKTWHYVVVIGYTKTEIIIANPSGGQREILQEDMFKRSWSFDTDMEGNITGGPWKKILDAADVYGHTYIVTDDKRGVLLF